MLTLVAVRDEGDYKVIFNQVPSVWREKPLLAANVLRTQELGWFSMMK